ncbi:unnamed protein product [Symbiodinium natans]|uniref:Uncharacterized protein n=1 Tax=Symbiodinium natans TaxID=878477 RepID=A0A812NUQ9_9DINO|nr:unnamed protein product [Symbiodinium natans]
MDAISESTLAFAVPTWKKQSEAFRQAIRQARVVDQHIKDLSMGSVAHFRAKIIPVRQHVTTSCN